MLVEILAENTQDSEIWGVKLEGTEFAEILQRPVWHSNLTHCQLTGLGARSAGRREITQGQAEGAPFNKCLVLVPVGHCLAPPPLREKLILSKCIA
jgi:hypothetical protein